MKPTYACNADCDYCYAAKEEQNKFMSLEKLESIFKSISENIKSYNKKNGLKFLWHGGEPLTMGKDFFKEVKCLSDKYFTSKGIKCSHQLQSNLTLIDDEYINVLENLLEKKQFGTSIDPFSPTRPLKNGKDYNSEWHKSVNLLRERGFNIGVVLTIHKGLLDKYEELYKWISDKGKGFSCKLNPVFKSKKGDDNSELYVTSKEFGQFLINMYEIYLRDGKRVRLSPFRDWVRINRSKGKDRVCSFKKDCQVSFLGIDYEGNVSGCGRFLASSDIRYGNVISDSTKDLFNNEERANLSKRAEVLKNGECKECKHWHYCMGGCPSIAYSYHGDFMKKTPWCEAYTMFFDYWQKRTKKKSAKK